MDQPECASFAEPVLKMPLVDPSSAQFRHGSYVKGYWSSPLTFGWLLTGEINARNRDGGYNGFGPYQVLLKNGAVIHACMHPYSPELGGHSFLCVDIF